MLAVLWGCCVGHIAVDTLITMEGMCEKKGKPYHWSVSIGDGWAMFSFFIKLP